MFVKRTKRIRRMAAARSGEEPSSYVPPPTQRVKETDVFQTLGIIPEVVTCQSK